MTGTSKASQEHRRPEGDGVAHAQLQHASSRLELMRQRLELVFWTMTTTLAVIALLAMTAQLVLSLLSGKSLGAADTATAVAIAGVVRLLPPGR
jgi:hypothetical protein